MKLFYLTVYFLFVLFHYGTPLKCISCGFIGKWDPLCDDLSPIYNYGVVCTSKTVFSISRDSYPISKTFQEYICVTGIFTLKNSSVHVFRACGKQGATCRELYRVNKNEYKEAGIDFKCLQCGTNHCNSSSSINFSNMLVLILLLFYYINHV